VEKLARLSCKEMVEAIVARAGLVDFGRIMKLVGIAVKFQNREMPEAIEVLEAVIEISLVFKKG